MASGDVGDDVNDECCSKNDSSTKECPSAALSCDEARKELPVAVGASKEEGASSGEEGGEEEEGLSRERRRRGVLSRFLFGSVESKAPKKAPNAVLTSSMLQTAESNW